MEKVLYEELRPAEFEARISEAPIAYLPLGTLEWHGLHLPLGSDGLQSQGLFIDLAREAGGVVLPMLYVAPDLTREFEGTTYIGMDFYGRPEGQKPRRMPGSAYYIPEDLFISLLDALLGNLKRAGIQIVVAHGHGPSNRVWREHRSEWEKKHGLQLLTVESEKGAPPFQSDHAAANESSIMIHYHPDLVDLSVLDQDPDKLPEAVLGDDPRYHASAEFGDTIVRSAFVFMSQKLKDLVRALSE